MHYQTIFITGIHTGLGNALARAFLDQDAEVSETVLRFEVTTLRLLGFLPSLDRCVVCGKAVDREGRVLFGQIAGGVLCRGCRGGQKQVVSLSQGVLDTLRGLAEPNWDGRDSPVDKRSRGELRGLLNHYLANLLGRQPRMHKYIGL